MIKHTFILDYCKLYMTPKDQKVNSAFRAFEWISVTFSYSNWGAFTCSAINTNKNLRRKYERAYVGWYFEQHFFLNTLFQTQRKWACEYNKCPWLSQHFWDFIFSHDFSRPVNNHFKIPWLFQVFHDRTNPVKGTRQQVSTHIRVCLLP